MMGDYIITPNFDSLIELVALKLNYIPKSICTEDDFNEYASNKETCLYSRLTEVFLSTLATGMNMRSRKRQYRLS